MFEGVVYKLVAGYLGHYFKDVQKEQLRIGLWNGVAFLENVHLRLESFDYLQLPVGIKSGVVGKLRLQIPWKKLGWEPIVVSIEDVVLSIGPRNEEEWDAGPACERAYAAKRATLAAAEILNLSRRVSEEKSGGGETFLSYFSTKIIDNVILEVKNVHCRYVDLQTDPQGWFEFGVTLSELKVFTKEPDAEPGKAHGILSGVAGVAGRKASQLVHKAVKIGGVSVYWNCAEASKRRRPSPAGPAAAGATLLLHPVNADLKITVSKTAILEGGSHQLSVSGTVDTLAFTFEEHQFRDLMLLVDAVSVFQLRERYGRFRPTEGNRKGDPATGGAQAAGEAVGEEFPGIEEDMFLDARDDMEAWESVELSEEEGGDWEPEERQAPACERVGEWRRSWWRYAILSVVMDNREKMYRRSWKMLQWRLAAKQRYIEQYVRHVQAIQMGRQQGSLENSALESLERELDVEDILAFRAAARSELLTMETAADDSEAGGRARPGWLSWLTLGALGAGLGVESSEAGSGDGAGALSEQDLKELYEAATVPSAFEAAESSQQVKSGQCRTAVTCHVNHATCTLRSSYSRRLLLVLSAQASHASLRSWADGRTTGTVTVGSLEAADLTTPGSRHTRVLYPGSRPHWHAAAPGLKSSSPNAYGSAAQSGEPGAAAPFLRSATTMSLSTLAGVSAALSLPVVRVEWEIGAELAACPALLRVSTSPLDLIFCPVLLKRLETFFSHPTTQPTHHELVVASMNALDTAASRTLTKARFMLLRRSSPVAFTLSMDSPAILLPESHGSPSSGAVLAVESGLVLLRSDPEPPERSLLRKQALAGEGLWAAAGQSGGKRFESRMETSGNVLEMVERVSLFDGFQLKLSAVQATVARDMAAWQRRPVHSSPEPEPRLAATSQLLLPFSLTSSISLCALGDDPTLTKIKVQVQVPALQVHMDPLQCRLLLRVLASEDGSSTSCSTQTAHAEAAGQWDTAQPPRLGSTPSREEILGALVARSSANVPLGSQEGLAASTSSLDARGAPVTSAVGHGLGSVERVAAIQVQVQCASLALHLHLQCSPTAKNKGQGGAVLLLVHHLSLGLWQRLFDEEVRAGLSAVHVLHSGLHSQDEWSWQPLIGPRRRLPDQAVAVPASFGTVFDSMRSFSPALAPKALLHVRLPDSVAVLLRGNDSLLGDLVLVPNEPCLKLRLVSCSASRSPAHRDSFTVSALLGPLDVNVRPETVKALAGFVSQLSGVEQPRAKQQRLTEAEALLRNQRQIPEPADSSHLHVGGVEDQGSEDEDATDDTSVSSMESSSPFAHVPSTGPALLSLSGSGMRGSGSGSANNLREVESGFSQGERGSEDTWNWFGFEEEGFPFSAGEGGASTDAEEAEEGGSGTIPGQGPLPDVTYGIQGVTEWRGVCVSFWEESEVLVKCTLPAVTLGCGVDMSADGLSVNWRAQGEVSGLQVVGSEAWSVASTDVEYLGGLGSNESSLIGLRLRGSQRPGPRPRVVQVTATLKQVKAVVLSPVLSHWLGYAASLAEVVAAGAGTGSMPDSAVRQVVVCQLSVLDSTLVVPQVQAKPVWAGVYFQASSPRVTVTLPCTPSDLESFLEGGREKVCVNVEGMCVDLVKLGEDARARPAASGSRRGTRRGRKAAPALRMPLVREGSLALGVLLPCAADNPGSSCIELEMEVFSLSLLLRGDMPGLELASLQNAVLANLANLRFELQPDPVAAGSPAPPVSLALRVHAASIGIGAGKPMPAGSPPTFLLQLSELSLQLWAHEQRAGRVSVQWESLGLFQVSKGPCGSEEREHACFRDMELAMTTLLSMQSACAAPVLACKWMEQEDGRVSGEVEVALVGVQAWLLGNALLSLGLTVQRIAAVEGPQPVADRAGEAEVQRRITDSRNRARMRQRLHMGMGMGEGHDTTPRKGLGLLSLVDTEDTDQANSDLTMAALPALEHQSGPPEESSEEGSSLGKVSLDFRVSMEGLEVRLPSFQDSQPFSSETGVVSATDTEDTESDSVRAGGYFAGGYFSEIVSVNGKQRQRQQGSRHFVRSASTASNVSAVRQFLKHRLAEIADRAAAESREGDGEEPREDIDSGGNSSPCFVLLVGCSGKGKGESSWRESFVSADASFQQLELMLEHGVDGLPLADLRGAAIDVEVVSSESSRRGKRSQAGKGESELSVRLGVDVEVVQLSVTGPMLHSVSTFQPEPLQLEPVESSMAVRGEKPSPPASVAGKVTVAGRVGSVGLRLLDGRGLCTTPVLEWHMESLELEGCSEACRSHCTVAGTMQANYHNFEKVAWEPLLEPLSWTASVTVEEVVSGPPVKAMTRVEVESKDVVNFNLTLPLVQSLVRANEAMSAQEVLQPRDEAPRAEQQQQSAPFWLENHTGVSVTYFITASQPASGSMSRTGLPQPETVGDSVPSTAQGVVNSGECVRLIPPPRVPSTNTSADSCTVWALPRYSIRVQLDGMQAPSSSLQVDSIGCLSFVAAMPGASSAAPDASLPAGDDVSFGDCFRATVLYEVELAGYSKKITLKSPVSVCNKCAVPLELCFDLPFALQPQTLPPIYPGQVCHIPVHIPETAQVRLRPACASGPGSSQALGWAWTDPQPLLSLSHSGLPAPNLKRQRHFVCPPLHGQQDSAFKKLVDPLHLCVQVTEKLVPSEGQPRLELDAVSPRAAGHGPFLSKSSSNGQDTSQQMPVLGGVWSRVLAVVPPLEIANALPCCTRFWVQSARRAAAVEATVEQGKTLSVLGVEPQEALRVWFAPAGYQRSRELLIPTSTDRLSHRAAPAPSTAAAAEGSGELQEEEVRGPTESVQLAPEDPSKGLLLCADVAQSVLGCGSRMVSVSCPFWLYNTTQLSLAVKDAETEFAQELKLPPLCEGDDEEVAGAGAGQDSGALTLGLQGAVSLQMPVVHDGPSDSHLAIVEAGGQRQQEQSEPVCVPRAALYSPPPLPAGLDSPESRVRIRVRVLSDSTAGSIRQLWGGYSSSGAGAGTGDRGAVRWSDSVTLDTPTGVSKLSLPHPSGNGAYVLAMSTLPAGGLCEGTSKTVTFRPRYLVANTLKDVIHFKQYGTDSFLHLGAGMQQPFHWADTSRHSLISLRFEGHGWDWSGGLSPETLGDCPLKMRNHSQGSMRMLRVEVRALEGSGGLGTHAVLVAEDHTSFMPYRIDNFSREILRFHQQRCESVEDVLRPYNSCSYAWDEPCLPKKLVLEVPGGGGTIGTYSLDEVRDYGSVVLPASIKRPERTLQVSVRADGPIRVLSIVDIEVHSSFSSAPSLGHASVSAGAVPQGAKSVLEIAVCLPSIGISIVDPHPTELLYMSASSVKLKYSDDDLVQSMDVQVAHIQADNQLKRAVYPVLLAVSPLSRQAQGELDQLSGTGEEEAALSAFVSKWQKNEGGVLCLQRVALRLAPVRLELEEKWLLRALQFTDAIRKCEGVVKLEKDPTSPAFKPEDGNVSLPGSYYAGSVVAVSPAVCCWPSSEALVGLEAGLVHPGLDSLSAAGPKLYIQLLHISAIDLTISFASAPWLPQESRGKAARGLMGAVGIAFQRGMIALADVEGARTRLAALQLSHPLGTLASLGGRLQGHYLRQVLHLVYKVLGSADFLGNPMGFLSSLGNGLWDFVATPATSLVQRPQDIAQGMARGTASLLKSTVFAFSNSATRITGAAAKGVASLALDEESLLEMESRQLQSGYESTVWSSLLQGLTGVLEQPVKGLEKGGIPGLVSGAARGLLGAVARPTASVLDLAEKSARSIRNSTRPDHWPFRPSSVVRPARHLRAGFPLEPFSREEAIGQAILQDTQAGVAFRTETLLFCMETSSAGQFLVLTDHCLAAVVHSPSRKKGQAAAPSLESSPWQLEWKIRLEDMLSVMLDGCSLTVVEVRNWSVGQSSSAVAGSSPFAHGCVTLHSEESAQQAKAQVDQLLAASWRSESLWRRLPSRTPK